MAECFVIQPFDNGKFDRRYEETFAPAVKAAGLEPYRVDKDPSVTDLVEGIEDGIERADAILADVTIDNPNVWYELGYALAKAKPFCIICSRERVGSYPFDVGKLKIIPYDTDSASDYSNLGVKITERLRSVATEAVQLLALSRRTATESGDGRGLSALEEAALLIIFEEHLSGGVAAWSLIQKMNSVGFTKAATTLAVMTLLRKEFIAEKEIQQYNDESYEAYFMTPKGIAFIEEDPSRIGLNIRRHDYGSKVETDDYASEGITDDDIPF